MQVHSQPCQASKFSGQLVQCGVQTPLLAGTWSCNSLMTKRVGTARMLAALGMLLSPLAHVPTGPAHNVGPTCPYTVDTHGRHPFNNPPVIARQANMQDTGMHGMLTRPCRGSRA